MKNTNRPLSTISYIPAFLIGAILFWSFGKDWLNVESAPIFLAGLIGVAVAVLASGIWDIFRNSHNQDN